MIDKESLLMPINHFWTRQPLFSFVIQSKSKKIDGSNKKFHILPHESKPFHSSRKEVINSVIYLSISN